MDEVTATVSILERNYSLRVSTSDVETLKAAAARIDAMAQNFSRQFPSKDHQDHVAMAALLQEIQLVKLQQRPAPPTADIEQRLASLDNLLDSALANGSVPAADNDQVRD